MNDVRFILATGKHKRVALVSVDDFDVLNRHKWESGKEGYFYRREWIDGKRVKVWLHRCVLGNPIGKEGDHKNGFLSDNTRRNLRECSHSQNGKNQRKQRRFTTSAFKGVSWHQATGGWQARIGTGKKSIYLGVFASEKSAALAYNAAASRMFGEFAKLNTVA
jgi:hypothetical protein